MLGAPDAGMVSGPSFGAMSPFDRGPKFGFSFFQFPMSKIIMIECRGLKYHIVLFIARKIITFNAFSPLEKHGGKVGGRAVRRPRMCGLTGGGAHGAGGKFLNNKETKQQRTGTEPNGGPHSQTPAPS